MSVISNPFDESGFTLAEMTQAINSIPNMYGLLGSMGLFRTQGVSQRVITIDEREGVLNLLQTQPWRGEAPKNTRAKGRTRSFEIQHIPLDDRIYPDDYQGIREFGSTTQATLASVMFRILNDMRNKHAITLEHLRMGAVKGNILDADGTSIYNLFSEFGITQKSIDFALGTATTKITDKCKAVSRHMEDNLRGEVMSGIHCLCSEEFFDGLIAHDEVEKYFLQHSAALNLAGGDSDPRKGFKFQGIIFEEYRGKADQSDGSSRRFIAAGEAHFFPLGTMDTFVTYFAPANLIEANNTIGQELYAHQAQDSGGRWVDIYTQSNPLPLCRRPALLVKGTA